MRSDGSRSMCVFYSVSDANLHDRLRLDLSSDVLTGLEEFE